MYYGERFNSITHLVGAVMALVGFGALITVGVIESNAMLMISFMVFGFTLVLLYTMSTLYHSFHPPKLKKFFQKLDHVSIYLLIAGTYTPYMLVSLRDGNGPYLLTLVWVLAIIGILIEVINKHRVETLQIGIYLIMGWVCIVDYSSLNAVIPTPGMVLLTVGGIIYTVGIIFYVLDYFKKLNHAHGIWHLFVLAGSTLHFISIIAYVR